MEEGKSVYEPFGELVATRNNHIPGKERRPKALCVSLGLEVGDVGDIRYQLLRRRLHCTARLRYPIATFAKLGRAPWWSVSR